jgi:diacylglycerol kinase family enzyme
MPMVVSLEGSEISGVFNSVSVANGQYYGGGMHIAPQGALDDGLLNVIALGDLGKFELLWHLPRVYRGTHVDHPKVQSYQVREVVVRPQSQALLQADGEVLGEGPATFRVIPRALRVRA